jgi:hypothetical protein
LNIKQTILEQITKAHKGFLPACKKWEGTARRATYFSLAFSFLYCVARGLQQKV